MIHASLGVLCFFLSGLSGLVYEISWIRKASLVFGSSTFALTTVLAVFFAGLAIGSYLFGRIGQKLDRPIRCYAMLEVCLAVLGFISPHIFDAINNLYGAFFLTAGANPLLGLGIRFFLISIVLLPPTILMGGTLPLFCRQLVNRNSRIARQIGVLYGINTLGGAAGCLLAGFVLIPEIGVVSSIRLAAGINVVAAVIAWTLPLRIKNSRSVTVSAAPPRKAKQSHKRAKSGAGFPIQLLGLLFFLVGFVAIGNEVLWARFLSLLIRNSIYTYTITLAVVLVGIVLGSLGAALLFDKRWPLIRIFVILQVVSSLITFTLMTLDPTEWRNLGHGIAPFFALMLFPASIAGACFPLLSRIALNRHQNASRIVGLMTGLNILGGIFGSLFCGFIALPVLGLHSALVILTAMGIFSGLIALIPQLFSKGTPTNRRSSPAFSVSAICLSVAAFGIIISANDTRLPESYLGPESRLVDYQEGYGALLSVVKHGANKQLQIDRLWQGSNAKNHQIMAAHVPLLLHEEPRDALVIGLGVGQTPSRFLYHDIQQLDVIDIEPRIFSFVKDNFDSGWMDDPRVRLIAEDGRTYIDHGSKHYDVIAVEIGQVFRPGVEVFYTLDFYRQARRRLHAGGLLSQFVPLAFFTVEQFRGILATFQAVFPQSVLWYNTQEMLLIGIKGESLKIQPRKLEQLTNNRLVNEDLRYSPWGGESHWVNQPDAFLAGFFSGANQIKAMTDSARLYIDDRPVLAYEVSEARFSDQNEIPIARLLAQHLSPVSEILTTQIPNKRLEAIAEFRNKNLNDLIANAYLSAVIAREHTSNANKLIELLEKALSLNPQNAMANRMMANAQLRDRDPEKAVSYYLKCLALRNNDAIAHRGLAMAYGQLNRLDKAMFSARKALQRMPDDPDTLNVIGLALAGKGRIPEAIQYLKKSLSIDPSNQSTIHNLALANRLSNKR